MGFEMPGREICYEICSATAKLLLYFAGDTSLRESPFLSTDFCLCAIQTGVSSHSHNHNHTYGYSCSHDEVVEPYHQEILQQLSAVPQQSHISLNSQWELEWQPGQEEMMEKEAQQNRQAPCWTCHLVVPRLAECINILFCVQSSTYITSRLCLRGE